MRPAGRPRGSALGSTRSSTTSGGRKERATMLFAESGRAALVAFVRDGEWFLRVTGRCVVTGKPHTVEAPAQGFADYNRGALLQDAFPTLTRADREFLKSGMTDEGWNLLLKPEED